MSSDRHRQSNTSHDEASGRVRDQREHRPPSCCKPAGGTLRLVDAGRRRDLCLFPGRDPHSRYREETAHRPARFRTFQQYRSSRRRRTAVAFAHWGTCVIETRDASDFDYGAVEGGVAIIRFGALLICSTAEGRPSMDAWTALLNRTAFWRGTSSLGDRSIQNAYRSLGC